MRMVGLCSRGSSWGLGLFARVAVRVGWRGGSQTYLGPSDEVRVRDMMIDRVAPCRGAAAQSDWAVRGHRLVRAVVARSDSAL
jgi:hypothetical protein